MRLWSCLIDRPVNDDTREDLAELFARYQFHMIPVVDEHERLLGVVHYHDIMKGLVTRARS